MAEPTVSDAVALLRDPQYRTPNGNRYELRSRGLREVSGGRILNELLARGAEDREAAYALVRTALAELGGEDHSRWRERTGLRAGRMMSPQDRVEVFVVPVDPPE
jgi:hypothetical protein